MEPATTLHQTALNAVHRAAAARMVDFGGWDMPVQYSSILEEHHAVRTAVGLFDVSHMGEIDVRGPQALDYVNYFSSNDAARLKTGQVHYSGLLNDQAGFVDDILVHKVADDHYFLCINAGHQDSDFAHIVQQNRGFDAQAELTADRYAQLAIQGPKGLATLQKMTVVDLSAIKYYWFVDSEVLGVPARIARTGYTGEDGFEIYIDPAEAPAMWANILDAGAEFGIKPCGLGARNTLRLEAKMALYGHEINAETTPWEADLGWIVKMDKPDFVGKAALAAQQATGITRKLVGFEMVGRGIGRDDYPIAIDGTVVGKVTSGGPGPTVGKNIGLGYVPVDHAIPGKRIDIIIRNQPVEAVTVPTPFYKRAK